ncbi:pheromone receptor PREB [Coccidioides immitis H538.4]|uniref:Pheromone receptor PREB n=1 Tax=Coccidioides immitis H538.4 TaxID=396776 RepID=A0A0J8RT13_COCIT|nr:pheromone receptor PREB [Coccidioides immitis H538.4]
MVDTSGFGNNFDPFTQPVRLYYPNGTDFHRSLAEIDWILRDNTNQSIAYGCQLGASLTMIIILLLLTPPGKRRSLVFMLNAATLVLNFGRILCSCIYYTTGFSDVYAMLAPDFSRVSSLTNILTTVSICYFSTIFVAKLGFAIHARRTLGLTGFGAMQVMFIMSCQSMIVPARRLTHDLAIFSILHHFIDAAEMAPLVLTLVTLSLPLSSMWAAQAVKNSFEGDNRGPTQQRHLFTQGSSTAQTSMASSLVAKRTSSPDHLDRLYPDIDAIEIRVDRDFTVDIEKGQ